MAQDWLDTPFSLKDKKIFVAGQGGMVGMALVRRLMHEGCEILDVPRARLDLREQSQVREWMDAHKPDVVIMAAAKVGGIGANMKAPGEFLYDNLMMEANVIHGAHEAGVEKLLFLGSSCIYPKNAAQPIREEALLTGALEETNEPYAVAKIAGVKLCQSYRAQYGRDFISAMPCNLYGPGDMFDEAKSHVIPALMMKAHAAQSKNDRTMDVWGSGKPLREFLYIEDLADALVFLLKNYSSGAPINVGSGKEISIAALAELICETVNYDCGLVFNKNKPDGTPRKLMDSSRLFNAGWRPQTELKIGLCQTYEWYKRQSHASRVA